MIKKTITYVDYNGNERTESFYFNLTQAELTEMEFSVTGGFKEFIQKIIDAQDGKQLIELFKQILLSSYGEKSPDGRRFIKSKELSEAFSQTEAYVKLFIELASNADKASEFINGIVPEIKNPN